MKIARTIRRLKFLALLYMQDRSHEAQTAAEIGPLVASLNGHLLDDGKAISFAAAALLVAAGAGWREHSAKALTRELDAELRALGESP